MNRISLFLVLAIGLVAPARADVTAVGHLTITSVAGEGSGSVLIQTSGLRRREERSLVVEGPIASAQPETAQTTIARLDRAVLQQVFTSDSTYAETPLAQVLANFRKGSTGAALPGGASGLDVAWTVSSSSPGGHATIAGFAATQNVLTMHGKGTQKATGQAVELVLTLELWTAPGVPGAAEVRAFDTKYAAAVGLAPGAIEESMAAFGVSRAAVRELGAARAKITGTPLRTVLSVAMPSLGEMMKQLAAAMPGATGDMPAVGDGPLLTTTLEIDRIDLAKIAPERFNVPTGFRKRLPDAPTQ